MKLILQREITKKLGNPKQPTNPFLEMIKFLLERIAPVHIDTESIRYFCVRVGCRLQGLKSRLLISSLSVSFNGLEGTV